MYRREEKGAERRQHSPDGRYDITQFPQYDCAAFGSSDYYSYVAGNLKQCMDDHDIADVRKGMQGLKGKPYAAFTRTVVGAKSLTP